MKCLSEILKKHRGLGHLFQKSYHPDPKQQLHLFCERAVSFSLKKRISIASAKAWSGTGVSWFFCSPQNGSSCKRLLMWLRWMVRQDEIDPGLWSNPALGLIDPVLDIPNPARLYHPVDAHILKWAQKNKLVKQKSGNWKTVETITNYFKNLNSADPVKYDFALCHDSMILDRQG